MTGTPAAYWTDPASFAVGRRPGRALVDRFDSLADLDAGRRTNRLDLCGEWDFEWVHGLLGWNAHAAAVAGPGGSAGREPDRIPVPALWQLHGYGTPYYLAFGYPPGISTRHVPRIDQSQNEAGVYATTFDLPAGWVGRRISVVFEGVKAGLLVYCNGREVGYSEGSFTPAEFDLTGFLVPGVNRLTAVVIRYTTGTYLEDQDMWFLAGIFRPVYLLAEPVVSMTDVVVRTGLDRTGLDRADLRGTITAEVTVENTTLDAVQVGVDVLLRGPSDAARGPAGTARTTVPAHGRRVVALTIDVPDPALWSAEAPNLYEVVAVLRPHELGFELPQVRQLEPELSQDAGGAQVLAVRTGIRELEIAGGQLLLNGVPIQFHGVNRHDFDPDHGWAVPEHRYREDLLIAKRLNINAVRCSHYPNPQRFYDLCDELGLYVIDECDLETHGVRKRKVPGDDPTWTAAVVDRMERMVAADRNHPSIVMWSLGNEAGVGGQGGGNFARMRAAAQALDDTRPFHYEGDHQPGVSDVISRMYATAEELAGLARGEPHSPTRLTALTNLVFSDDKPVPREWFGDRPVMQCEFAHAMGNSLGNFAEYMDVFDRYSNVLGGFVWDFVDQSLRQPGADGRARWRYGGDFGETPNHRYFCNNGLLGPDRAEHPHAREVHWGYRPIAVDAVEPPTGRYAVRNRTSFTPGRVYLATLELRRDGVLVVEQPLDPIDVAPGQRVEWEVPQAIPPVEPEPVGAEPVDAADLMDPEPVDAEPRGADGEWIARFVFRTTTPTPWASAGFVVGSDEFVVIPVPPGVAFSGGAGETVGVAAGRADVPEESEATGGGPTESAVRALTQVARASRLVGRTAELAGRGGVPVVAAARGVGSLAERLSERVGRSATSRGEEAAEPATRRSLPTAMMSRRTPTGGVPTRMAPTRADPTEHPAGVTCTADPTGWTVRTPGTTLHVDRGTGHLDRWSIAGPDGRTHEVLSGALRPNYWRAQTDNDRGYGNIDARLQHVLVDPAWCDARPRVSDARITVDRSVVTLRLELACPLFRDGFLQYTVLPAGAVDVHHALLPELEMYRMGLTLRLPEVDSVRWYGKGPYENYVDRNRSAFTAIHELGLAELAHRYVRPQENGNRTEVRWLEVLGPGMVLRAQDLTGEHLGFTVWAWTQEHLDATEHDDELVVGREATLNIDRRQRGVGGDLPGVAALLPVYTMPAGRRQSLSLHLSATPLG